MIKSITIENYKLFDKKIKLDFWNHSSKKVGKEFILENKISSVIGILGKNASGKSTIIEAILFYASFNSDYFFDKISEDAYFNKIDKLAKKQHDDSLSKEEKLTIGNKIQKMFVDWPKPRENLLILKKEIDEWLSKKYNGKAENKSKPICFKVEYYDKKNVVIHKLKISAKEIYEKIIFNEKEIYENKTSIYGFAPKLIKKMEEKNLETIITGRILKFSKKIIRERDEIEEKIKNCIKKKPKLFLEFLKIADEKIIKFLFKKDQPVAYISTVSNKSLTFDSLSDGTLILINLYEKIYDALFVEKSFLLLDEIENSLHFVLIKFIITIFKKRYNKLNSQLLFSTHNPYIFDNDFKSNSIYFIDNNKLIKNEKRFDRKIAPGYFKGELISNPDHQYRFNFLKEILNTYEKNN